MDSQTLQLSGSLAAILVLAGIAWVLRLGQTPRIEGEARAVALAREADSGFDPVEAALSGDGAAALLADSQGRIMVLRPHGTHFAGRILDHGTRAAAEGGMLTIIPADRRYGPVTLDLGDSAQAWESRIQTLQRPLNA